MKVKVSNAPVSWGMSYVGQPGAPPWQDVLREIRKAGYRHTELGPIGFYPEDPAAYGAALAENGLTLVAGHVMENFHDARDRDHCLDVARRVLRMIAPNGAKRLVVIDHVNKERSVTAGRPDVAPRLDRATWKHMLDAMLEVARMAHVQGVTAVLHPHAATYVEYRDEINRAMDELAPDLMKLCVDTGHSMYAGVDPVDLVRVYGPRVQHLHFKDVNPSVRAKVVAEGIDLDGAVSIGVFCRLGSGMVDFAAFRSALEAAGYDAAGTVEQDVEPNAALDPIADAAASLAYLKSVGIA
jgi:inosose dehydratase